MSLLAGYGIGSNLLGSIKDFLNDRGQRVVSNDKSSYWSTVSAGVPQGSVLSPLFFLVCTNDLPEGVSCRSCSVKLFADDTSLFSVVKNESETGLDLNGDLEKIRMWAWQWKMLFNADKTEEVIFSRKELSHTILQICFVGGSRSSLRALYKAKLRLW